MNETNHFFFSDTEMIGLHRVFCIDTLFFGDGNGKSIDMQMYCKGFMNFSQSRYEIVECQSHGLLQPAGMFDNVLCDIWSNIKSMTSVWLGGFFQAMLSLNLFFSCQKVKLNMNSLSCHLNWEENQNKGLSTQIENVEAKSNNSGHFLACTWRTAAALCPRINCPDLLITY